MLLSEEMKEEEIFEIITAISLELADILKKEVNVLFIDSANPFPIFQYSNIPSFQYSRRGALPDCAAKAGPFGVGFVL